MILKLVRSFLFCKVPYLKKVTKALNEKTSLTLNLAIKKARKKKRKSSEETSEQYAKALAKL